MYEKDCGLTRSRYRRGSGGRVNSNSGQAYWLAMTRWSQPASLSEVSRFDNTADFNGAKA
jgi:hypothetical protein